MNKKNKLIGTLGLCVACAAAITSTIQKASSTNAWFQPVYVDFFNNYLREDFELSNGVKGKGNNLIYLTVQVTGGDKVSKPADPVRDRYEFQGWYKEETCENEWVFDTEVVTKNTRLFAKWGVGQKDQGGEPEYVPPSTVVPDEAGIDYTIKSVMNFKVSNGQVKVSKAALDRLEANADNVLPLLEYKVKAGINMTATYADNKITVTLDNSSFTIAVKDDSNSFILDNSNYENKAKNYEAKIAEENENYHVMLAGSSSIEFWTSSKEDLEPVVSYNHGIGGTTIEQWDEQLNQRLVYPYKPKMVVYYVGINNVINSKQSATTIWNNLQKFFNDTHEALPDTKVQYIMMNLIPGYKGYWDVINAVNAEVVNYQKDNSWLTLINPGEALLKANGEPNAAYFRTDGLHLSYYGYVVWGEIIKQSILAGLQNK